LKLARSSLMLKRFHLMLKHFQAFMHVIESAVVPVFAFEPYQ
jgi:hypothetical protein